jgi:signal transduction histidine kinase
MFAGMAATVETNATDRILMHLAEIGARRCSITDETIVAEPDPDMRQVLLGLLVLHEDLSYASQLRSEAEAALRLVAEERERLLEDRRLAIAARDQFLAVAAHELRTPLTTLSLLVDHLLMGISPEAASEITPSPLRGSQLPRLKRQIDRLNGLVSEMLDVSRITGGGLDLVPGPVDLGMLVQESVDRFEPELQRRQIALDLKIEGTVRGYWDGQRIDQVVTNLLSNAIKYGEDKPIEVSVRARGGRAIVTVRDHGVGIPPEEQNKIFGPFARAVAARHHAGLGLGLWIAHKIVQASGGRIVLESAPGEGSSFTVELPL